MKPDLVAVGEEIVTAAQNSFPSGRILRPVGLYRHRRDQFLGSAGGRRRGPF